MTWANRITIGRCVLALVFICLLIFYHHDVKLHRPAEGWRYGALAVFFIASISDAIDGYLAKHCGQATPLGALLDPIADKFLLFSALVMLSLIRIDGRYAFPVWFPIIVIGRDFFQLVGFSFFYFSDTELKLSPHWTSKLATTFNFLSIGSALLVWRITPAFYFLGAFFTLASGLLYLIQSARLYPQAQPVPVEKISTGEE